MGCDSLNATGRYQVPIRFVAITATRPCLEYDTQAHDTRCPTRTAAQAP